MFDAQTLLVATAKLSFLTPIILALTQFVKQWKISPRYMSLIAALIGVVLGAVAGGLNAVSMVAGLLFGLAATGLYEVGSTAIGGQ